MVVALALFFVYIKNYAKRHHEDEMTVVHRSFKIDGVRKRRPYFIYSQEEADAQGLEYGPWRDAPPGEWGLDDAGYVSQCIRRSMIAKSGVTEVRYPFARTFTHRKKPFGYGITQERHWAVVDAGRTRTKEAIKAYVALLMNKTTITEEDKERLGRVFRPDQRKPARSWDRLMRQQPIKDMVTKEIARLLERAGVTPEKIIGNMEDLRKAATADKQYNVARQLLDRFADMYGMKESLGQTDSHTSVEVDWDELLEENKNAELPPWDEEAETEGPGSEVEANTAVGLRPVTEGQV